MSSALKPVLTAGGGTAQNPAQTQMNKPNPPPTYNPHPQPPSYNLSTQPVNAHHHHTSAPQTPAPHHPNHHHYSISVQQQQQHYSGQYGKTQSVVTSYHQQNVVVLHQSAAREERLQTNGAPDVHNLSSSESAVKDRPLPAPVPMLDKAATVLHQQDKAQPHQQEKSPQQQDKLPQQSAAVEEKKEEKLDSSKSETVTVGSSADSSASDGNVSSEGSPDVILDEGVKGEEDAGEDKKKEIEEGEVQVEKSSPEAVKAVKEQVTPQKTQQSPSQHKPTPQSSRTPSKRTVKQKEEKETEQSSSKSQKSTPQKAPANIGKRIRTQTQPYQSPIPEMELISKMASWVDKAPKGNDEKLIVFYKNEFLAVRNAEGGFYVCQAMQNIYKSSPKIRIRWLSQDKADKNGELYTPDFYDHTDFDCILTNLNLVRIDKGKYRLPGNERIRTDSILKRALAVEKGDATPPSLTEEHPDGLDLSLYKEESQLKKRKGRKRKSTSPMKAPTRSKISRKTQEKAKAAPKSTQQPPKPIAKRKPAQIAASVASTSKKLQRSAGTASDKKKVLTISRAERAAKRRRGGGVGDAVPSTSSAKSNQVDQKKAKVLAKVARKGGAAAKGQASPVKAGSSKVAKQTVTAAKAKKAPSTTALKTQTHARKTKRPLRK